MEHHSEGGKKGSGHGDAKRRANFKSSPQLRREERQNTRLVIGLVIIPGNYESIQTASKAAEFSHPR